MTFGLLGVLVGSCPMFWVLYPLVPGRQVVEGPVGGILVEQSSSKFLRGSECGLKGEEC